jgi:hypothetical protein
MGKTTRRQTEICVKKEICQDGKEGAIQFRQQRDILVLAALNLQISSVCMCICVCVCVCVCVCEYSSLSKLRVTSYMNHTEFTCSKKVVDRRSFPIEAVTVKA